MDSQLAALLLSDKIDLVVQKDSGEDEEEKQEDDEHGAVPKAVVLASPQGRYVKGYSHLSLSQPIQDGLPVKSEFEDQKIIQDI